MANNPAAVFFVAMDQYVGGWATKVKRVLNVSGTVAALLPFPNAITRYC